MEMKKWENMTSEEKTYAYARVNELLKAIVEIDKSMEHFKEESQIEGHEKAALYCMDLYTELRKDRMDELKNSSLDFNYVLWFYLPEDESENDKYDPYIVVMYEVLGLEFRY